MDNSKRMSFHTIEPEPDDYGHTKARIKYFEDKRKLPPSTRDLRSLLHVLKDFGIKMKFEELPHFETYGEMERWQSQQIIAQFN